MFVGVYNAIPRPVKLTNSNTTMKTIGRNVLTNVIEHPLVNTGTYLNLQTGKKINVVYLVDVHLSLVGQRTLEDLRIATVSP